MLTFLLLSALSLSLAYDYSGSPEPWGDTWKEAEPESHIVGGSAVNIANFPWQGSYRPSSGSHSCGCVFVGYIYVLSAGHCGGNTGYTVEFGSSQRGFGYWWALQAVYRHPNYGQGIGNIPNDIMILYTYTVIQGTNIYPGVVPSNTANPGGTGWITGWGQTCGNCGIPLSLQGVQIPIISDVECALQHGSNFQASFNICVWGGSGGSIGACYGDSGGPMSKGEYIYGVTSWGPLGCLTGQGPSVYTRVAAFYNWICANTNGDARGC